MQIQINDRILSSMARRLEEYLAALGKPLKHSHALTATAKMLNFANANTMMAVVPKAKDRTDDIPTDGREATIIGFLWSDTHEIFETRALLTPAEAARTRAFLLRMRSRIEQVYVGPEVVSEPGTFAALSEELRDAFLLDASEEEDAAAIEILEENEDPASTAVKVAARFDGKLEKVSENIDVCGYLAHAPYAELETLAENDWKDTDGRVLSWIAEREDLPLFVGQAISMASHQAVLQLDPGISVVLDGPAAMVWLKSARPSMHARLVAAGHNVADGENGAEAERGAPGA